MVELLYTDLGRMDYPAAVALQERIVELKQREHLAERHTFRRTSPRLHSGPRRQSV